MSGKYILEKKINLKIISILCIWRTASSVSGISSIPVSLMKLLDIWVSTFLIGYYFFVFWCFFFSQSFEWIFVTFGFMFSSLYQHWITVGLFCGATEQWKNYLEKENLEKEEIKPVWSNGVWTNNDEQTQRNFYKTLDALSTLSWWGCSGSGPAELQTKAQESRAPLGSCSTGWLHNEIIS